MVEIESRIPTWTHRDGDVAPWGRWGGVGWGRGKKKTWEPSVLALPPLIRLNSLHSAALDAPHIGPHAHDEGHLHPASPVQQPSPPAQHFLEQAQDSQAQDDLCRGNEEEGGCERKEGSSEGRPPPHTHTHTHAHVCPHALPFRTRTCRSSTRTRRGSRRRTSTRACSHRRTSLKLGGWKERDEGKTKGREEEGSGRRGRGGGGGWRARERGRERAGKGFFFLRQK